MRERERETEEVNRVKHYYITINRSIIGPLPPTTDRSHLEWGGAVGAPITFLFR